MAAIPTLIDLLEDETASISAAANPEFYAAIGARVSELTATVEAPGRDVSLEVLFDLLSVARGLHEASQNASDPSWGEALHCRAQDMLADATAELSCIMMYVAYSTMGRPQ